MLNKPLEEEQADMRARWADPSYRWANDSEIRKRYTKEFRENREQTAPNSVHEPRHNVEKPHSGGSEETEAQGEN